ncbi:ATP-binding cassette domain-containing protein [Reyranella sp. CPCC 100927]|uniref:ATP-binding cassette domain-containing protein n=1 Tax=Reyranella sp. CPCC 100927 TaxID=2599616 RepID=UPI0011B43127|nr:ATP-binding cassette domain-containing protein [Reyranella sp. CPCC 100927]TWT11749.1 ABC-F family ATP-binding cassette domain-containing protein [Reyranella sp. CPCC 100927]
MGSISLRNVSVLAPAPLFQNLTLVVGDDDRLGLVAGNGAGKTTLLKCLAGLMEPTTGDVVRSRGLKVGIVEQEVPTNLLGLSLSESIRRALAPAERDSQAWRVDLVLDEFDTPADMREQPLQALSGGWQRLALIARTWVTEPDALLLDEPTNHLDLAKIALLEAWINHPLRQIPMVIASHDRHLLDACTTRTLFLRPEISRSYAHPYTRARALLADDDAAQEAKFVKDSREADRLRQSANALKNIGINSGSDASQKKAMQMHKRADSIEQSLRAKPVEKSGDIRLANRGTHARVLVRLDDIPISTPDGRLLFRSGKLAILQRDRIIVLGRNGVGKSRFVALLRQAMMGHQDIPGVSISPTVVPGYIDQLMSHLPQGDSPMTLIGDRYRLGDARTRSLLAGAGFAVDRQQQPIARLSPGQKARLGLLALRLAEPNLYLMDEPTNHVDIPGQERLEAEILAHEATCVLVSHDRSFMATLGTRFLLIDGNKMMEIDAPKSFHLLS